jgi:hypothetical protein
MFSNLPKSSGKYFIDTHPRSFSLKGVMHTPPFQYNDGGRSAAGYQGNTGDCVCRAIAIAARVSYSEVYELINETSKCERKGKRKRGISSARSGVYKTTYKKIMERLGAEWTPLMGVGTGCQVHVRSCELPSEGRYILSLSKHWAAWIDGVLHDTHDCSRNGTRCVYGYWKLG